MPSPTTSTAYRGRYAPSPTGELHLGNIQTALLAWLHARLNAGEFLLRMEDLDTPRVVKGSAEQIIEDLTWLGLDWDGPIVYQSERTALYAAAFARLERRGYVFPCFCSRKDIREETGVPYGTPTVYPGTCRNLTENEIKERSTIKNPAFRVRVLRGSDDFVIKRADGIYAYHLAVTHDDLAQNITHVVRGADLHDSQMEQGFLAQLLAPKHPAIAYISVPLKLDENGSKMSKRDGSDSLNQYRALGYSAPQIIAQLSNDLGFTDNANALTADELLKLISIDDWNAKAKVPATPA